MAVDKRRPRIAGVLDIQGGMALYTQQYRAWQRMINRCYNIGVLLRQPTYIGCSVCDEWLTFSNFKRWYDENYRNGYHLDKDILVQGNKVYGPNTCRYVPQHINKLLTDSAATRGEQPLGVCRLPADPRPRRRKTAAYSGKCHLGHGRPIVKYFKTPEEAQAWYAETKRRVVREVAQKALDAGEIQQDVFDALVARTFVDMSACRERGGR